MDERKQGYWAHSKNDCGSPDYLSQHLKDVARKAAGFAAVFGAAKEAEMAALLHDLGKYGDLFQKRLEGKARGIDHWSPGAWVALMNYKEKGIAAALAVQGHHIGLQRADRDALGELNPDKLQANHPLGLKPSEAKYENLLQCCKADGLDLPLAESLPKSIYEGLGTKHPAASMLDIRMLYSALVDADYLETEAHFEGGPDGRKRYRQEGPVLDAERTLLCLRTYLDRLASESKAATYVNQLRADLLNACSDAASKPQGIFTLTSPTGTGKTFSMLAFALAHAAHHGLRRVVAVIPYLTIIEQTVDEYRKALADIVGPEEVDHYILEHHSLAGIRGSKDGAADQDMEDEPQRRARLLVENWDAPIVVTTSVQLLESLFSNRPATCRKLHRLASSVILFDEVQTLPLSVIIPTLATLSRLAERYRTTLVFATATQPAFGHLDSHVKKYAPTGWQPAEIVPKERELFKRAKRTEVEWPDLERPTPWTEIAKWLVERDQALCVVNLKKHALRLFQELREKGVEGCFHLSTSMCPAHRKAVLEEIHRRLVKGEPCRLVSTQCVEAGVDLDFPIVYRALGPLDAIAQAAGRCNRHGSLRMATVRVFLPEEEGYPDGAYQQAASVTRILLGRHGGFLDIHDPALFTEYFKELYGFARPQQKKPELLDAIERQDFVRVSELYRVIEEVALNVLVPYDIDIFRRLKDEVWETGLNRRWIARARPYTVGLFKPWPFDPISTYLVPVPLGRGESAEDWFIYTNADHYDPHTGLVPPEGIDCLVG